MYISFHDLNLQMMEHPFQSDNWEILEDKDRLKYYNYIHYLIDSHPWKGAPLQSPMQIDAFPRKIGQVIVRWNNDTSRLKNHIQYLGTEHILPNYILVEAVVYFLSIQEFKELITQRDEGIVRVEVGPLKAEMLGNKSNTLPFSKTPLPKCLWDYLKQYSLFEKKETSETFRIERV